MDFIIQRSNEKLKVVYYCWF